MAANAVAQALEEVMASLAAIAPEREGLRDYDSVNLIEAAHREVQQAASDYDRRLTFLNEAKRVLEQLLADGHPLVARREVSDEVIRDLDINLATITAARGIFTSGGAVALTFTEGAVEPK